MLHGFLVGSEKGGVEYRVYFPVLGNTEMVGSPGNNFFNFKWTSSFHEQFSWSVHSEVGHCQPNLVPFLPRFEFGGDSFLHFVLGDPMCGYGIVSCGREFQKSSF